MEHVIVTENLSKRFGRKEAVRQLTLAIPSGGVFAFIGPNGAGKTTTIKMLMNIIKPAEGRATVLGSDSTALGPSQFRQIGYVSEETTLLEWMTVSELLAYCRPFYPTWDADLCNTLLRRFALAPQEKVSRLSRGMRVKVALLSVLSYRPRLLVLDEPFAGLDAVVREDFIRGILELVPQEDWSVFISSHDIDEVEPLADRVGLLDQGELQFSEAVSSLQSRFRQIEVTLKNDADSSRSLPSAWLLLEKSGRAVRFVHSQYNPASESEISNAFTTATRIAANPMSLKAIFKTLVRAGQAR